MRLFPYLFQPVHYAQAQLIKVDVEIVCADRCFTGARDFVATFLIDDTPVSIRIQGGLATVPRTEDQKRIFGMKWVGDTAEITYQRHRYHPDQIRICSVQF
ncbi:MAG: hypothetical protein HYT30_01930 [Parcubacteria group bacterium]|nr:hypothetical protein [Parcubacteria group bacterium]